MIVEASGDHSIRPSVIDYLKNKKKNNPSYKVIDIAGAANPWCDDWVDAYVDIKPVKTGKRVFRGNLLQPDTWTTLSEAEKWDFSICTHVLEDVRSPQYVIEGLLSISSAGFIAMPNKHTEFSHIESRAFLGYCHHRWIFTIANGRLLMIAKFPIVNYFSKQNSILRFLRKRPFSGIQRKLGLYRYDYGPGLDWVDSSKVFVKDGQRSELGFIWEDSFEFESINNDYADSGWELAELYRIGLEQGL